MDALIDDDIGVEPDPVFRQVSFDVTDNQVLEQQGDAQPALSFFFYA
jgi:hypothetical protein